MIHLGLKVKARKLISKVPMIKKAYYCNCCNYNITEFFPYGGSSEIYKKHNIIGGGKRKACCPICGSIDRWRWFQYVLENHTDILTGEYSVLHFAPEREIKKRMMQNEKCWYLSGDLLKENADIVMDITDIPLKDDLFDYVIVNHVMSYVRDEKKAFDEIKRVLKKTGTLIVSFPICTDTDTFERFDITTDEESLKVFGVKGNCRMYGRDYKERLEGYGFEVREFKPTMELSASEIERLALIPEDSLLFCTIK